MIKKSFSVPMVIMFLALVNSCMSRHSPTPSLTPATKSLEMTPTTTLPAPTRTPTRVLINTRTHTFTPVSTLSPEEAYARLRLLLNDTENCQLPCMLGIAPGQSTWDEVVEMLTEFSSIAPRWLNIGTNKNEGAFGDLSIPYPGDNMVIEISLSYQAFSNANKVLAIWLNTRSYKLDDSGGYAGDVYGYPKYYEVMKPYTISEILSVYGPPSHIYVNASLYGVASLSPHITDYFILHILYPKQGILIDYKMAVAGIGDNYHFCPSNAAISAYLMSPESDEEFMMALQNSGVEVRQFSPRSEYTKTPGEAFGMTTEEFYQLFLSSPNSCLETPKAIWWP